MESSASKTVFLFVKAARVYSSHSIFQHLSVISKKPQYIGNAAISVASIDPVFIVVGMKTVCLKTLCGAILYITT